MSYNLKVTVFVSGICMGITLLVCIAAYKSLFGIEENGCDMTYMYEYPEYIEIKLKKKLSRSFPRYKLYLYGEGAYASELRRSKPTGIPVLFIPGNAGSHRQVRSLASVALRKAETRTSHFNYFTIDFDEDFGGLFGGVLIEQTKFAHSCLRHILRMYKASKNPAESVVLIGHSMGGVIARALFTLEGFQPRLVHLIITLGTPHVAPVIPLDTHLTSFYFQVNNFWNTNSATENVTLVSFAGGSRDILVPSRLCSLHHHVSFGVHCSAVTTAIPDVWLTIDHLALCWCKQLVLVINCVLFDLIDKKTQQIIETQSVQRQALQKHFGCCKEETDCNKTTSTDHHQNIPTSIITHPTVLDIDKQQEISVDKKILLPVPIGKSDIYLIVLTADIKNVQITSCKRLQNETCISALDLRLTRLPTSHGKAEFLYLSTANVSHIVMSTLKYKTALTVQFTSKNTLNKIFDDYLLFAGSQTFLTANNIFSNISLPMVRNCFDVFLVTVTKVNCENSNKGLFTGRVHFPWFSQDIYASSLQSHEFSILLKAHIEKPVLFLESPQLHVWDLDKCSHHVVLQHQLLHTLGQIFKLYAPYFPQWIYFWTMVILSLQIAEMSDTGVWLSIWSTVTSKKLLKILPLFVLINNETIIKALIISLGKHYISIIPKPFVNSCFLYDWFFPSSFIVLTALTGLLFLNTILSLIVSFVSLIHCSSSILLKLQSKHDTFSSSYLFYGIIGPSIACLAFICSSLVVYLLTIITFIYCCNKSKVWKQLQLEKSTNASQISIDNQLNLGQILLVLLFVLSLQTTPAFIVWLKVFSTSWRLPSDPFFSIIFLFTPTVICLLQMELKRPPRYLSWAILSVWCLAFILFSLDKLSYIVALSLLVMDYFVFCKHIKHVKTP